MRNGDGFEHMGHGGGGWIFMLIMMVIFWGGLAWVIVTLLRSRGRHDTHSHAAMPAPNTAMVAAPPAPVVVDPAQILAERLARGDIDVDDYRARIAALRADRPTG